MKFDFDSRTPGIRTLPVGQLDVSNSFHSCAWRGLAASKRDRGRPRLEHDVDDVGERHVAVVRALVVAPADVHAQLLGRDVAQRVVQRLDVQLAPRVRKSSRSTSANWMWRPMPRSGQSICSTRPAVGDRLVLVRIASAIGVEVLLARGVVVVAEEERDHARRRGGQERRPARRRRRARPSRLRDVGPRAPRGRARDRRRCTPASCAASGRDRRRRLLRSTREVRRGPGTRAAGSCRRSRRAGP